MIAYKLRFDITDQVHSIHEYIQSITDKFCYVKEKVDENPHIHYYLETDTNSRSIRSRLRNFGLEGNGAYSLKKCELFPIAYLAYLRKEGKPKYYNFTDEEKTQISEYDDKVKQEMKIKKENKKSVFQRLLDGYETGIPVLDYVIQFHIDNGLLIRRFQIQAYVDSINLYKAGSPEQLRKIIHNMFEKN